MKIPHFSPSIALLFLPALSTAFTTRPDFEPDTAILHRRSANADIPPAHAHEEFAIPKAGINTNAPLDVNVPVDGQDGRPHAGPWVVTSRKKTETDGGGGRVKGKGTQGLRDSLVGRVAEDGVRANDGVMDDPNRTGPKEGTRGTEGGVSEKQKGSSSAAEKRPGSPKEAPGLGQKSADGKDAKGGGDLGMLGVCLYV